MHLGHFKKPRGILKIVCLMLVIIDLVIARIGFASGTSPVALYIDPKWVNITSVCSFSFILPIIIICYLMGDEVPVRMEMLFQLIGAILFLASGSLITDVYQNTLNSKDVGLALGSMEIITGIVMFIDFALLAKELYGKK